MAVVTKKSYCSNISKITLFDFYSSKSHPDIFTSVSMVNDWISKTIR